MSVIITFMFEPAKLQMNCASASGTSIFRSEPAVCCSRRSATSHSRGTREHRTSHGIPPTWFVGDRG